MKPFATERFSLVLDRVPVRAAVIRWFLLVLGVVLLVLFWWKPKNEKNLALGASVEMSSNCWTAPLHALTPVGPSLLVDGLRERDYDACTGAEHSPWAKLDFGGRVALERIVVSGRADCCWATDTLPLLLEVSDDNQNFREIRRRTLPFTRDDPWIVTGANAAGRYLRVRVASERPHSEIVLSEVEVYGQRLENAR